MVRRILTIHRGSKELKILDHAMVDGLTEKEEMRQKCLLQGRLVSRAQCQISIMVHTLVSTYVQDRFICISVVDGCLTRAGL